MHTRVLLLAGADAARIKVYYFPKNPQVSTSHGFSVERLPFYIVPWFAERRIDVYPVWQPNSNHPPDFKQEATLVRQLQVLIAEYAPWRKRFGFTTAMSDKPSQVTNLLTADNDLGKMMKTLRPERWNSLCPILSRLHQFRPMNALVLAFQMITAEPVPIVPLTVRTRSNWKKNWPPRITRAGSYDGPHIYAAESNLDPRATLEVLNSDQIEDGEILFEVESVSASLPIFPRRHIRLSNRPDLLLAPTVIPEGGAVWDYVLHRDCDGDSIVAALLLLIVGHQLDDKIIGTLSEKIMALTDEEAKEAARRAETIIMENSPPVLGLG